MGAGLPKDTHPFQSASELLEKTKAKQPKQGDPQMSSSRPCGLQDQDGSQSPSGSQGEAPRSSGRSGDPHPGQKAAAKGRPRKQQLLASAALRDSQDITRFLSPPVPAGTSGTPEEKVLDPSIPEEDTALAHLVTPSLAEACTKDMPR